jgi:hypothetical protein
MERSNARWIEWLNIQRGSVELAERRVEGGRSCADVLGERMREEDVCLFWDLTSCVKAQSQSRSSLGIVGRINKATSRVRARALSCEDVLCNLTFPSYPDHYSAQDVQLSPWRISSRGNISEKFRPRLATRRWTRGESSCELRSMGRNRKRTSNGNWRIIWRAEKAGAIPRRFS